MPLFDADRLTTFVADSLAAAGLLPEEARTCAYASTFADLRGASTHGVVYVVPRTLDSLQKGATKPGSKARVIRENGAMALMSGEGVAGPVFGTQAMLKAIKLAQKNGIGTVNTQNGGPIALLGYYAHLAAERNMIGIVMANTAPAAAPYGATSAVLGTNPFAYSVPSSDSPPFLFDVATTVASAGKLKGARRRGEILPPDWMIDAKGDPVTDPKLSKDAVMLPCGGHKGSGFSLLVHLLTGALSQTAVGGEPTHNNTDAQKRGQSALFLAIDPAHFGPADGFLAMVERQIEHLHAATPLNNGRPATYPGERGWRASEKNRNEGIPVAEEDWALVAKSVRDAGLSEEILEQLNPG